MNIALTINGKNLPIPREAEALMAVGKHTVLRVDVPAQAGTKFTPMDPLTATFGAKGRTVYGYVDRGENSAGISANNRAVLWGVGASAVLKDSTYRTFQKRNLHGVLAELAYEYNMVPDLIRLPRVYTALVQHGSTWEFINEQARRAGVWIWCDGLRLRMRDPLTALKEGRETAIPFTIVRHSTVRRIIEAHPAAEVVPGYGHEYVGRVGFSMDDRGKTVAAKVSPKPLSSRSVIDAPKFERVSRVTAGSRAEIESDLTNMGSASLLPYTLRATLAGHPDVVPMSVIALDHAAPNVRGHWLVEQVTHRVNGGGTAYHMEVVARRDTPVDSSPATALLGRTRRFSRPSGRTVNGRWRP